MSTLKVRVEYRLFRFLQAGLNVLPRGWIRAAGRRLGDIFYLADRSHRRTAHSNLAFALGEGSLTPYLKRTARRACRFFGETFLDMLCLARRPPEERDRLLSMEGEAPLLNALAKGKGALLISAHFGQWEMAPALISRLGRLNVVARPLDNPLIEAELEKIRFGLGETVIPKHQAARRILKALRNNEMVAILMDQNVLRREAVFVDFFGKPAATTPAPATFHLRTGAPIFPVFCVPDGKDRYRIRIQPSVRFTATGDAPNDIIRLTQACTRIIEEHIRRQPELWFWFHDRWRSRPDPDSGDGPAESP